MTSVRTLLHRLTPGAWRFTRLSWLPLAAARAAEVLDVTFGRPEWFMARSGRGIPRPADWRGRIYLACWAGVVVGPAMLLWSRGHNPEAILWLCAAAMLAWGDLRRTMQAGRGDVPRPAAAPHPVEESRTAGVVAGTTTSNEARLRG